MSRQDRPAAAARPHRPVTPLLDQSWEVAQRSSGQWTCRSYLLDILSTAHTICVLIIEVEVMNDTFAYFLSKIIKKGVGTSCLSSRLSIVAHYCAVKGRQKGERKTESRE